MKLTKARAKKLSLEVWEYLRDHPEIKSKYALPYALFQKVKDMPHNCPLCAYLFSKTFDACGICPLRSCATESDYYKWVNSPDGECVSRARLAAKIVEKIKAW